MSIDLFYTNQHRKMDYLLNYLYKNNINNNIPIAAMVVKDGDIISIAINNTNNNPLDHAEILVLNKAINIIKDKYLLNCDLYITLEPCPMCAQAISLARINRIYFAALSSKSGALYSTINLFNDNFIGHKPEIYYLENKYYMLYLSRFF